MSDERSSIRPRTFYLSERHELARTEKDGGGRPAQYGEIDWSAKSTRLSKTLTAARHVIEQSPDPTKDRHFFMTALPVPSVQKRSKSQKKAPHGTYEEETRYAGEHSRVFRRLGMDLLDVDANGVATVHASADRFDRLVSTASALEKESAQERGRWVTLDGFAPVPAHHRIDAGWLDTLKPPALVEVMVEMQPLLSRLEIDEVIRSIAGLLKATLTNFSSRRALTSRADDGSGRRCAKLLFGTSQQNTFQCSRCIHHTRRRLVRSQRSARLGMRKPQCTSSISRTFRPSLSSIQVSQLATIIWLLTPEAAIVIRMHLRHTSETTVRSSHRGSCLATSKTLRMAYRTAPAGFWM
jgi:hypothetical protein